MDCEIYEVGLMSGKDSILENPSISLSDSRVPGFVQMCT